MMVEAWDCLLIVLTAECTMVGFATLESLLSIGRLTVAEIALDTALSGAMEEKRTLLVGSC